MELADSEIKCPLCGTEAFLPNGRGETPYPKFVYEYEKIKPIGIMLILACVMMLSALLTVIINVRMSMAIYSSAFLDGDLVSS